VLSPIEGPDGAKVAESMKYWNIEMKVGRSNHFTIRTPIISAHAWTKLNNSYQNRYLKVEYVSPVYSCTKFLNNWLKLQM
jgi:hypothetical protein